MSFYQLEKICTDIIKRLDNLKKDKVKTRTILSASPKVIKHFKNEKSKLYKSAKDKGITIASQCPVMHMNAEACGEKTVATNSNKLRTYTSARYFQNDDLLNIICGGKYNYEV